MIDLDQLFKLSLKHNLPLFGHEIKEYVTDTGEDHSR